METKKSDRRVRYTKMVIKDSFIKFLKQKPISHISITEICDDADINRATFYAHYQDQYDLLRQIKDEALENINQYIGTFDYRDAAANPLDMTQKILEYILENAELFDLLLNSNGDEQFQQEVIKTFQVEKLTAFDSDSVGSKENEEYVFRFLMSGSIGIIQLWLKNGAKKPVKEMAELLVRTAAFGRSAFE